MRNLDGHEQTSVSPYQDYYLPVFEYADMISAFWQPVFKMIGRQNLEIAQMGAKGAQAALQWSRNVATSPSPAGLMAANTQYWRSITQTYTTSSHKMASVAAEAAAASHQPSLVTLPVRRARDTIQIPQQDSEDYRKVA